MSVVFLAELVEQIGKSSEESAEVGFFQLDDLPLKFFNQMHQLLSVCFRKSKLLYSIVL